MENVCKEMIDFLKLQNSSITANEVAFTFIGDNVMSCAYGLSGKSFSSGNSIMQKIRENMSMSTKIGLVAHTLGLFFPKFCHLFNISYLGKQTPPLFKDLISMAIKTREESKIVGNDFIDYLAESRRKDDKHYMGYAMSFYLDGFETGAYTFVYVLLEVARNPLVQEKARKEVDGVYSNHNTVYSYEAVKDMHYVESIIYETLRKHPSIKFLNRVCTKDYIISAPHKDNNGKQVIIKKGTHIFIPVEAIHRDEKYFPYPKEFNPSRFNQDTRKLRLKQNFLGFGDGPRVCLGQKFAVTQLKMALAAILLNFKISINNKTVFQFY